MPLLLCCKHRQAVCSPWPFPPRSLRCPASRACALGRAQDGRLAAGDQLLSVDGRSLVGLSQERYRWFVLSLTLTFWGCLTLNCTAGRALGGRALAASCSQGETSVSLAFHSLARWKRAVSAEQLLRSLKSPWRCPESLPWRAAGRSVRGPRAEGRSGRRAAGGLSEGSAPPGRGPVALRFLTCVTLSPRAAELMTRTTSVVTLEVAKQGAIYHGLATLLSQPSPTMQRRKDGARPLHDHAPCRRGASRASLDAEGRPVGAATRTSKRA